MRRLLSLCILCILWCRKDNVVIGGGGGVFQGEGVAYFKYIGGGVPSGGGQLITWGESTKLCYIAD